MRVAIMQPYFLPYIGYFQLLSHVDLFVIHDDIEFSKGGWLNRNRISGDSGLLWITLSLAKASDYAQINEREIAPSFDADRMLRQVAAQCKNANQLEQGMKILSSSVCDPLIGLVPQLLRSLTLVAKVLEIDTPMTLSSQMNIAQNLRGEDRVLAICEALEASSYLNPEGGTGLYSTKHFRERGVELEFLRHIPTPYRQVAREFHPRLSIMDALLNLTPREVIDELMPSFEIFSTDT
jgi:hypothetical protein